ncbi:expressed unknown protein [Seminavis robusta]|uniref:Uncharacterized protein n=1 Tax=Seminavis robusta TaxID=568900 RepID=A0A9N8ELQ4_9STRA|nr:expressed unknown protein [Seminavis robusta]|eukprot:Sro1495_g277410.1 n/a (370) ;mRNA; f:7437-8546
MTFSSSFTAAIFVLLFLQNAACSAEDEDIPVTLHPLRYCADRGWMGCNEYSYPYGTFWKDAGMLEENQDMACMAIMGEAPSNPKYLVIFSSGQGSSKDLGSVVSGAHDGWQWDTTGNGGTSSTVNRLSVAAEFYQDQTRFLPNHETLYLTLFDSQFNHMDSANAKQATLNGYAAYLDSKVLSWDNIKGIVIAGASRGGCLSMRLSQHLRAQYNLDHVKFALGTIDGVCKYTQNEFGVTSDTIDNPLPGAPAGYKAYKTNIPAQLQGPKEDYCIWQLTLGDDATGRLSLGIRGFTHETCSDIYCELLDGNGDPFYTQVWDDLCHSCATMNFDEVSRARTSVPLLDHLAVCVIRFGWGLFDDSVAVAKQGP